MIFHIIAFICGFIMDLIIGDPYCIPHPIRWIGSGIAFLEKRLLKEEMEPQKKRRMGGLLVGTVLVATVLLSAIILFGAYYIHPYLGCLIESIMTYQLLATKCLKDESMKVYKALEKGRTEDARKAVSMIVGRDTNVLDDRGIAKAAVETVAENTSDGVIAPMIYMAIGGPVLGFFYKAVNTMDSMIGYKSDKYLDFGRRAAKLDDFMNYIPSRISGWLMIFACFFLGKDFDGKNAKRIYLRDRYNHASPNSAQTEATCAGALHLQLAGPAVYFGKPVEKPFIGDSDREIEYGDIKRANALLYGTGIINEIILLLILLIFYFVFCI